MRRSFTRRRGRRARHHQLHRDDELQLGERPRPGHEVPLRGRREALFYRFRYGRDVEFICLDTSKEGFFRGKRLFESWSDNAHFLLGTIEGATMAIRAIGEPMDGEVRDLARYTPAGGAIAGPITVPL